MKSFPRGAALAALTLMALGAAGCASSQSSEELPQTHSDMGTLSISSASSSFDLRVLEDVYPVRDTVSAIVEEVWSLVPEAYVDLGVPIEGVNAEARLLGTNGFRASGDLGGLPVTDVVNCGRTLTGDIAEEYDLHLEVVTQVHEADGRSILSSVVEGTARPRGVSGNTVHCSSTGELEQEIVQRVRTRLVGIE